MSQGGNQGGNRHRPRHRGRGPAPAPGDAPAAGPDAARAETQRPVIILLAHRLDAAAPAATVTEGYNWTFSTTPAISESCV